MGVMEVQPQLMELQELQIVVMVVMLEVQEVARHHPAPEVQE
jgi:hypothetical protein